MKHVLIINGHPNKESYNYALSEAYLKGARKRDDVEISQINLNELDFNPVIESGDQYNSELEPDLQNAIAKIKKADHLVWVFPMWWYGSPALMKGFIDRTFLPKIAFKFEEGKVFPKKLFKGKSARLIITADTPRWYDKLFMRSPAINQLKKGTLEFCGIKPVKVTYIAPIIKSKEEFREKWLTKVYLLGEGLQ
ncbi:flavodoxin family protein [Muricauda sp. JGD-17]|uniref:Flavodoxin family protein n=1 Tax=Flagellimonas ochracea TaxID=2696472 RepID=A0A964TBC5_9FLAO|nr:NAD(P)H-dependent oxidoreductase [Allomuricauda ochracea]NAY91730.1 flavodoxin family protein [Allomuricauda ochracea]